MQTVILAIAMILALVIIILGIANHKKRIEIYEDYKPYFGPFKAYMVLTLLLCGALTMIIGIPTMFISFKNGILSFLGGALFFASGVLICYLTNKKACEDGVFDAVKKMILAGFGTIWALEIKILKVCCFVWIIVLLRRRKVTIYTD